MPWDVHMPDGRIPANNTDRLALIQRLWQELAAKRPGSKEHRVLTKRIRQEADAFRASADPDDPTKS